jgi:hypothetical protein
VHQLIGAPIISARRHSRLSADSDRRAEIPMSATNCTDAELAETREWIIQVCMERYIAAGMTEAEARAIVEEAMNTPRRYSDPHD